MPRTGDNYDYPAGTLGISGQTIFSARYNAWVEDIKSTLNLPLPISKGGTGADNVTAARDNLNAEVAMATVTNYDDHVWENGSFWSAPGASAAPVAGTCSGISYVADNNQDYVTVESRDANTGVLYIRQKAGGVWLNDGAWKVEGEDRYVNITGDTMTGDLTIATTTTGGTLLFGGGGTKYLQHDGTDFRLVGGATAKIFSDVWAVRLADTAQGAYFFGGTGTKYLSYDGANFNLTGGALIVTTGTYHFGSSGTKYLNFDGTNFNLAGGPLFLLDGSVYANVNTGNPLLELRKSGTTKGQVIFDSTAGILYLSNRESGNVNIELHANGLCRAGLGVACRSGFAGVFRPNTFNIDWAPGAQLWIDTSNLGTIAFTSDYRVKKDVVDLPGTWETVKALRPVKYTQAQYTPQIEIERMAKEALARREQAAEGGAEPKPAEEIKPMFEADDKERWGFIAHELQETLIEDAATGYKDAPDYVQSPNPWTVIAALTKALQEAMTRIEALEATR